MREVETEKESEAGNERDKERERRTKRIQVWEEMRVWADPSTRRSVIFRAPSGREKWK